MCFLSRLEPPPTFRPAPYCFTPGQQPLPRWWPSCGTVFLTDGDCGPFFVEVKPSHTHTQQTLWPDAVLAAPKGLTDGSFHEQLYAVIKIKKGTNGSSGLCTTGGAASPATLASALDPRAGNSSVSPTGLSEGGTDTRLY